MDKASFDIPATHHHMATVNDNEFGVVDGVVKIGPWEYVLHDRHHHNNNNNNNHNGFEDSRLQEQLEYETWVKDPGTAGTKASTSSFSSSSKAEGQGETGSNASSSSPSSRLKVPQWLRRERQDAIAAHEVAHNAHNDQLKQQQLQQQLQQQQKSSKATVKSVSGLYGGNVNRTAAAAAAAAAVAFDSSSTATILSDKKHQYPPPDGSVTGSIGSSSLPVGMVRDRSFSDEGIPIGDYTNSFPPRSRDNLSSSLIHPRPTAMMMQQENSNFYSRRNSEGVIVGSSPFLREQTVSLGLDHPSPPVAVSISSSSLKSSSSQKWKDPLSVHDAYASGINTTPSPTTTNNALNGAGTGLGLGLRVEVTTSANDVVSIEKRGSSLPTSVRGTTTHIHNDHRLTITSAAFDLSTSDRDVDDMVAVSRRVSLSSGGVFVGGSGEKPPGPGITLSGVNVAPQSHQSSSSPHSSKLSNIFDNENVV